MRTIIAGSRDLVDYQLVVDAVKASGFNITKIVSGGARGIDSLGERYALENKIPLSICPAQWDKFGKSAGYKRNEEMAAQADALIAIRLNSSKGTSHMIDIANKRGLAVHVIDITRS